MTLGLYPIDFKMIRGLFMYINLYDVILKVIIEALKKRSLGTTVSHLTTLT